MRDSRIMFGFMVIGVFMVIITYIVFFATDNTNKDTMNTMNNSSNLRINETNEYEFYIFGERTCPHCSHLKTTLMKKYGDENVKFYDLLGNEKYLNAFSFVAQITKSTGVPQVGIFVNGSLRIVFVGDFTEIGDSDQILSNLLQKLNEVEKERQHRVIFIVSDKVYGLENEELIKKLENAFLSPESFK